MESFSKQKHIGFVLLHIVFVLLHNQQRRVSRDKPYRISPQLRHHFWWRFFLCYTQHHDTAQ